MVAKKRGKNKGKKLISFDLDQTLVSTIKAHIIAFKMAFKKKGINIDKIDIKPFIDGRHSHEVITSIGREINRRFNLNEIEELRELHHFFLRKTVKYAAPIDGVYSVLKRLKKNYELALVTNCAVEESNILLKSAKIEKKIFNVIVLANQVKRPKPWPDEIFKAEKILHVKSDIHVGDSIYDVIAAKRAKAIAVSVLTGQTKRKQLEKYHPDFIIKSIEYLPDLLKKNEI